MLKSRPMTSPRKVEDSLFKEEEVGVLITEVQFLNIEKKEHSICDRNANEKSAEDLQIENVSIEEKATTCDNVELTKTTADFLYTDDDYDTDLDEKDDDQEDVGARHDAVSYYKSVCEQLSVAPVEYFLRHIRHHSLRMRNRALGPEATKAIALSLKDSSTLERLDISGNWIGTEGARFISRLLELNDHIMDVALAENKIGSDGGQHIARMVRINTGLRRLDLSGNELDDRCAEALSPALATNKHLRELNISHNKFTEVGAQFLGLAIGANENLEVLNLSWNSLRERGGIEIAKHLKENIRLKTCNLSWNGLATQGGLAVAEAMMVNQSLTELDISGNRLTYKVAVKMAKVFSTNDAIKVLKMGNNQITSAGAIALISTINNTESCELQELDLTGVPVEYEFLRTVGDIQSKKSDFKIRHGTVMRAGNTTEDLCKPAIDVTLIKHQPVVVPKKYDV